jgi:tRNA (guanine-N7-)-methyltransferase
MRSKLKKFAELLTFPNVYENPDSSHPRLTGLNGEDVDMKGQWNAKHFKNNNPITLELACGRGEYAVALGRMFPNRNFIGVDIKGGRIHQGARAATSEGLNNVAFLRTRIEQVQMFFAENEVDEIWITFPDPFLRESKSNRRLTSPQFLERYRQFLKPDGLVHLKTDSPDLYDFTLQTIVESAHSDGNKKAELLFKDSDIYSNPELVGDGDGQNELSVSTYYEKKNIANSTIKYIRFKI